ncbi:rod shape-determining protein RodA [Serpentinicella sp. ANB-PHB4]|uniref:rod shape-determining protein RodA n=1 Tax=Serpentinicella sp. ANB-PHB4 TaxID=3074076 RepID=UPI0028614305|nr:rod shape-determining protein RodA [Serpentinicella sp. ANB-PHB4]MDR5659417.1 rod shape-determining protein RodA [Serpentinicella sp. ANB-PHB4]
MQIKNKMIKKMDFTLVAVILIICVLGVFMVGQATGWSESHIRTQVASVLIGFAAIIVILFIDYNQFAKFYVPIYILSNLLLVAVLVFGTGDEQWGARRWIRIGGFGFQPSDFVKIGMIICIAKMLSDHKENLNKPVTILKILVVAAIPMALVARQPDLGTTMAFVIFTFGMFFVAGLKYKYIIYTALGAIVSAPLIWLGLEGYQKDRILIFLNPELDPMGRGYQIIQSKITVGSGQFFGLWVTDIERYFHEYGFLPEKHTDFIFSITAQILGFAGVFLLLICYMILLIRCIDVAREAKDDFGAYMATGVTFMLAFHIFANIAMTIGLMPVTGKPLPFVSYGGTFMLSNMIAIGLVLNVNIRRYKINF